MKSHLTILSCALLCAACHHEDTPAAAASSPLTRSNTPDYRDADFSAWMTKAEQQVIFENKPEGDYFAYTEGRNSAGLNQYRHVLRHVPQGKYSEWAAFWGLNAEDFYQLDLKMLRAGFVRSHLQVFVDTQGVAFHQAVWLQPTPPPSLK